MIVKFSLEVVNSDKELVEGHALKGGVNQVFGNRENSNYKNNETRWFLLE